jgi:hypothetical protein
LRGKLDEQTGKDIYSMLTTLATHVFCMANAAGQAPAAHKETP